MALKRLSQVLEFASSVEVLDYDETFFDFKDKYDPNIVDKNKLLVLVSYLRVQIDSIPDEEVRGRLASKLEDLETEARKPKVRWGFVITGFFVLFGFVADLKTLDPTVYEKPLQTIESILSLLHKDGLVSSKDQRLLSERNPSGDDDDLPKRPDPGPATLPHNTRPKEDDDEEFLGN